MHSYEDRIRAVELYYRYGKKASVVVMELGYPSTKQLSRWVRIYEEKGDLPRELNPRERYSRAQKIAAVDHYLTHGGCLSYTRRGSVALAVAGFRKSGATVFLCNQKIKSFCR